MSLTVLDQISRSHGCHRKPHGFPAFLEGVLSNLNDAWPGFNLTVDNVISNKTDVVVLCTFRADGDLSGKGVHHFVVKDELQFSFDLYWDGEYWGKNCKI